MKKFHHADSNVLVLIEKDAHNDLYFADSSKEVSLLPSQWGNRIWQKAKPEEPVIPGHHDNGVAAFRHPDLVEAWRILEK